MLLHLLMLGSAVACMFGTSRIGWLCFWISGCRLARRWRSSLGRLLDWRAGFGRVGSICHLNILVDLPQTGLSGHHHCANAPRRSVIALGMAVTAAAGPARLGRGLCLGHGVSNWLGCGGCHCLVLGGIATTAARFCSRLRNCDWLSCHFVLLRIICAKRDASSAFRALLRHQPASKSLVPLIQKSKKVAFADFCAPPKSENRTGRIIRK